MIEIPHELTEQLKQDHELVVMQNRLVPLPKAHNVAAILDAWACIRRPDDQLVSYRDITQGDDITVRIVADEVKRFFDSSLPNQLLYQFEIPQYEKFRHQVPSQCYGAEHLARLLCKIPHMFDVTVRKSQGLDPIYPRINDLAQFLIDNRRIFFTLEYEQPEQAYMGALTPTTTDVIEPPILPLPKLPPLIPADTPGSKH